MIDSHIQDLDHNHLWLSIMTIIVITGIANVGGLAGTQMPERVLSDAYEKGGKQMIGVDVIIVIIFIIT